MANKDKHSQKSDYMKVYTGSKAEKVAETAKKTYHRPKKQKRKLRFER